LDIRSYIYDRMSNVRSLGMSASAPMAPPPLTDRARACRQSSADCFLRCARSESRRRRVVVKRDYAAEAGSDSWKVGLSGAGRCIAIDCGTTNGSGSRISFPAGRATLAAPRRTIDFSWRLSSIAIERASRGVTSGAVRRLEEHPQALAKMVRERRFRAHLQGLGRRARQRIHDNRRHRCSSPPA
jgi:hypothetical protein